MRVVSLVPSWTETLLEAGVEVVGRTRFCLHGPGVDEIPRVGGTKDWDLPKIRALKPDLLILDREENPRFMSEEKDLPFIATHVAGIKDMPKALLELGDVLGNSELKAMAGNYSGLPGRLSQKQLPAILDPGNLSGQAYTQVVYLIWKDPWMAVGRETFIGSVLEFCGQRLAEVPGKYPEVTLEQFDPKTTLLIFSSEPYPFLKKKEPLASLGFKYVIADGEKYSWFGIRNLRFLESLC